MVFRRLKPYTILIMATGKASITLSIRPRHLLFGWLLLVGLPLTWMGSLLYQNVQLAQQNRALSETATQVLTELDVIEAEIEILKNRAGLPDPVDLDALDSGVDPPPQGGVSTPAAPEAMLDLAKQRLPGLGTLLNTAVKPALEDTLASEAEQLAASPTGRPVASDLPISSEFGLRPNPFGGRSYEMHEGIDFAGPVGKPVLATADGVVVVAEYDRGYGNYVKIDHGYNYETLYAHLSELAVTIGDRVQRGDVLGTVGSTGRSSGPHLHYGIYRNGQAVNPRYYLKLKASQ
ncbi:MAG: M23 family peptidase [Leptolyngbya sp. LCM1.Bin17]|nr:MAG: M23 family peptidase [Leptolyngbya sp. LCM1.Bin17]